MQVEWKTVRPEGEAWYLKVTTEGESPWKIPGSAIPTIGSGSCNLMRFGVFINENAPEWVSTAGTDKIEFGNTLLHFAGGWQEGTMHLSTCGKTWVFGNGED